MTGPISAVHPMFDRDGGFDWTGLRNEIEHNLAAGSGTMLLTYGDSLHSLVTDAEMERLRAFFAGLPPVDLPPTKGAESAPTAAHG